MRGPAHVLGQRLLRAARPFEVAERNGDGQVCEFRHVAIKETVSAKMPGETVTTWASTCDALSRNEPFNPESRMEGLPFQWSWIFKKKKKKSVLSFGSNQTSRQKKKKKKKRCLVTAVSQKKKQRKLLQRADPARVRSRRPRASCRFSVLSFVKKRCNQSPSRCLLMRFHGLVFAHELLQRYADLLSFTTFRSHYAAVAKKKKSLSCVTDIGPRRGVSVATVLSVSDTPSCASTLRCWSGGACITASASRVTLASAGVARALDPRAGLRPALLSGSTRAQVRLRKSTATEISAKRYIADQKADGGASFSRCPSPPATPRPRRARSSPCRAASAR